jgi:alcohol dehydrogenase
MVGTIVDLAPDAPMRDHAGQPLRVGERVVWSIVAHCGSCFYCRRNLPQKCEALFKDGHERIEGERVLHGGLASHCRLVRGTQVFRVSDRLPDAIACPASCATATVAAALRHAGEVRDQTVLVQGAGMLGLTAAAWARALGASVVLVADPSLARLEAAGRFGATDLVTLDGDGSALRQAIATRTAGRGVDITLEMSGAPAAIMAGIEALRLGGRAIWVGAVFPAPIADFSAERVVRKHLTIHGIHNYLPTDLSAALAFLADHHEHYPFAGLVSGSFPLSAIDAAFHHARQSAAFRVAIMP